MHSLDELISIGFAEAPIALLVLSNRRIMTCSRAVEDVFGWHRDELVGQSIRVLYPTAFDYESTGARWLQYLKSRTRYQDERFMQHKSGEIFWTRASGVTLAPHEPFELMVWTFDKPGGDSPVWMLTRREREVAQLIANGRTSKEVAQTLKISHRTVEVHRAAVMRKLGAANLAELISKIMVIR